MSRSVPVTVAVAACDRPEGVARCLAGVFAGDVLPAEVLVVDQSRDGAVGRAVLEMDAPVPLQHVAMARRGLSASRNVAIERAGQEIVAFTDDDCVPHRSWIATGHGLLTRDPDLAGITGRVLPLGEDRPGTFVVSPRTSLEPRVFTGRVVPWSVGTGGNFVVWRAWLERIGRFDERLGAGSPGRAAEDADLLYRLLRAGGRVRYEPESMVYHERQTAAQRLSSRRGYGHGIGALCTMYLRRGDVFAGRMLAGYVADQGTSLARAVLRRDWFGVRQRVNAIQGLVEGVVYGWRVA
jgi:cellulose synthase/poly-beta-1,6-N-acetylglucosamine synthase-like glycosyltransferase